MAYLSISEEPDYAFAVCPIQDEGQLSFIGPGADLIIPSSESSLVTVCWSGELLVMDI